MKISNSIKIIFLSATLLCFAQVFADTVAHTPVTNDGNTNNSPDTSTQTGWQQQNANIESQQAATAAVKANTAAQNANTQLQNAETGATQANTASQNADAASRNANTAIIVTAVPAPKEVVTVPAGFINCTVVDAQWFGNAWVPKHQVCKYNSSKEGVAWVDGYWACTAYKSTSNTDAECTNWDWKAGHWVKTFSVQ